MSDAGRITVGIASRDRAESLVRCINSLSFVDDRIAEVIVVDDGSAVPVESLVRAGIRPPAANKLTVVRHESSGGLAAARNEIAQRARSRWVLMLDDDAALLSAHAVTAGIDAIAADDRVLAIAFAQADAEGKAWPPGAQPGAASYPCRVPTFIGFAHLLRRDAFIALGGYRAQILINGEEGELCLRALDAGWDIVFLPDALIAHLIDPAGRNLRRYLHLVVRNGCLASIYNDPFLLMCVRTPMRLASYFRMRAGWHVDDPWGFLAILRWLLRDLPQAVRLRHAVRWSTIRRWRQLARRSPAYRAPA